MSNFAEGQKNTAAALAGIRIVPVLALNSVEEGVRICEIFNKVGLPGAEITFRTAAAADVIKEVSQRFPDMLVGAGTVLNVYDLHRAFAAGAKFAVAPGFNPTVVKEAVRCGFAFSPGICTPSEVEQALELGCTMLKFFPAEAAGGVKMLNSIIAPYKHLGVKFMPTGGVTTANVESYLSIPQVAAVGGTWLGKSADIAAGNWDLIEETAVKAVEVAKQFPAK
ncbi:MAG: bifunctional 4-hydroxy-2-oxoglutarate aldolase/2-dehydro-3-deoxy-phosphogluconate aldolase [Lentisphaeria bacterium]|nr:bifunctional 4-hydroxy-2-oxoglutarate aldolase/2-dehydro-3-deoxy-phosphogluconate aldolase [Lentisphaeria bacterium]